MGIPCFSLLCCACFPGSGQECMVMVKSSLSQAPALNNRHTLPLPGLHSSRVIIGSPLGHEIYRARLMHPVLYSTPFVHTHTRTYTHTARAALRCVHSASLPPPIAHTKPRRGRASEGAAARGRGGHEPPIRAARLAWGGDATDPPCHRRNIGTLYPTLSLSLPPNVLTLPPPITVRTYRTYS